MYVMNVGKRLLVVVAIVAMLAPVGWGQVRTWTDATGKFSVRAELVQVQGANVVLKRLDGRVIKVPIARLSVADQAVARRAAAAGPAQPKSAGGRPATTPPERPSANRPRWTLDLAKVRIPDQPAGGRIHGRPFTPDRAELKWNGWLELRQGKDFIPDLSLEVVVFLKAGEKLDGRTVRITPDSDAGTSPYVTLNWRHKGTSNTSNPPSTTFMGVRDQKYAMILEFGKATGGKLPGRIYVCLPDKEHSVVAGTFAVALPGQTTEAGCGTISGAIAVPSNLRDTNLSVACLGKSPAGKLERRSAGIDLTAPGTSFWAGSGKPRETLVKWTKQGRHLTHRHINRPCGKYLVSVRGHERKTPDGMLTYEGYYDWKWIELTADQLDATVNLALDPTRLGTLEVTVHGARGDARVAYVPLDESGQLAFPEATRFLIWISSATVQNGKAVIRWLRQGKYQIAVSGAMTTAEVKAGQTTKVDLTVPRHKPSARPSRRSSVAARRPLGPPPADVRRPGVPLWTMELAKMQVPEKPASGLLHGEPFTVQSATLRQNPTTSSLTLLE